MTEVKNELSPEHQNNNKLAENMLISPKNTINKNNIKLENELLSSLFNNPPNFDKKYENDELNKFKDEMLKYLYERNQHYKSLINYFHDKIQEDKKEYFDQMKLINDNYSSILSSQAALNNKLEKISNIDTFMNKTNDQLITHEIRINNLSSDFIKATQKYDKIYLDNLELPGYIGKFAKFKNCQAFFENVIKELEKMNQYKEKNNLDIKSYKEKLDSIIKSIHLLLNNNNESQMKIIKQLNDKCLKESKEMNESLSNRICDLRIENAKYSIDLVKKNDEMNKEWKKILEIKDNIITQVTDKINQFKNTFHTNVTYFNNFKKEFEDFKKQIHEAIRFYKAAKINDNNANINSNFNSCINYGGCYISSALPLERKNLKYFSKKFAKKSKSKSKNIYNKKQFIKSISAVNGDGFKNDDNKAIKVEENNILDIANSNNNLKIEDNSGKEKEIVKRNVGPYLVKEKSVNMSNEKYKNISETQSKKNINYFKDSRPNKTVTKIEINSHDKINNIDRKNINEEKDNENENDKENVNNINKTNNLNVNNNEIQKIINSEENNIIINSSNLNKNQYKEKEKDKDKPKEKEKEKEYKSKDKERAFGNKFNKNKRNFQSNKYLLSEDSENNNKSNANMGNSITVNSSNDNNYSKYSTNSVVNVNKFVLNDKLLEGNKVIKELASELEQSTNKKDNLASNQKNIEDNFKVICSKISPLNINKMNDYPESLPSDRTDERYLNQNIHSNNNINLGVNFKANTVSTEKTEEGIFENINENNNNNKNNNIYTFNINQNDYNLLNKKFDLFDKKIYNLESLLKEKIIEILSQFDNLQNICLLSICKNKAVNQKLNIVNNNSNNNANNNNVVINSNNNPNQNRNSNSNLNSNFNINSYTNKKINRSSSNDYIDNNNIMTRRSNDDYFIKCHSMRKIAPIIEINPSNLQFSPSPLKTQNIFSSRKPRDQSLKRFLRNGTNHFRDIKLFRKNENKENNRNSNNIDFWDLTLNRISKNGNFLGVNKWINLNRLIKRDPSKTANISNNGGLLAGNFEAN